MQREIKFRVYCPKHEDWEIYSLGDLVIGVATSGGNEFSAHEGEFDGETWGQFTGLKDKNNKEIYEGDIISKSGAYVIWANNLACWCFTFKHASDYAPLFHAHVADAEVIGNIWKTPELPTPPAS